MNDLYTIVQVWNIFTKLYNFETQLCKCEIFLHNLKIKLTVIDLQEQIVTGTVSWNLTTPSVSSLNENICIVLYCIEDEASSKTEMIIW